MTRKIFLTALMIGMAVLLLGGCNQIETKKQSVSVLDTSETIKDSTGREIKVPEKIQRVIVLSTSTFNMITAIGAAETVIGVNSSTKKSEVTAANKEVFGSYMEPNIEKIIAAKPDLVISNSTMKAAQVKQLENAGVKVVFLEFYLPSILHDEIITLGKLFKREEQAQKYDDFIMKYRNLIETRLKDIKPENKVTVYFESSTEYSTVAHGTGGDELITGAGGINIAGQETVKYPKVNAEWILQKKPQVIVKSISSNFEAMGEGYEDLVAVKNLYDSVISRTGWRELDAVKNNKVLFLSHNIGVTPEGSIIGTLYMAKMMYPDRFSDIDPYEIYKQMEKEFFNIDVKGILVYP